VCLYRYVTEFYKKFGKPIWITEMGCCLKDTGLNATEEERQQLQFARKAFKALDALPFVERHGPNMPLRFIQGLQGNAAYHKRVFRDKRAGKTCPQLTTQQERKGGGEGMNRENGRTTSREVEGGGEGEAGVLRE
jgi:hypothetical protein